MGGLSCHVQVLVKVHVCHHYSGRAYFLLLSFFIGTLFVEGKLVYITYGIVHIINKIVVLIKILNIILNIKTYTQVILN